MNEDKKSARTGREVAGDRAQGDDLSRLWRRALRAPVSLHPYR